MTRTLFALALLALFSCSGERPATTTSTTAAADTAPQARAQPPSFEDARKLIGDSAEFGEFEFTNAGWTVNTSGTAMHEQTRHEARDLVNAGWLAIDGTGAIALTDKARNDKRFLLRPNGLLDVVPLAKKEMGAVTAVRANHDNTASADFEWKWIPNDVGAAFKTGTMHDRFATPRRSHATLIWDGTSWTVLQIE